MSVLAVLLAAEAAAAPAQPASGVALQAALRAVKQDGAVALSEAARSDVVALLPPSRKGEECPEAAKVGSEAYGLKDRGEGAIIVAEVTNCRGGRVLALSTGQPARVARLLDAQSEQIHGVKALSLGGGKRESDLGLEVLTSPTTAELRLYLHGPSGFGFSDAGTLKEFAALRECSTGAEEGGGWTSWVRTEQDHLAVLRVDSTCGRGAWQAMCILYRFEQGALARSGTCNLPPKLDAKALRASGWK